MLRGFLEEHMRYDRFAVGNDAARSVTGTKSILRA